MTDIKNELLFETVKLSVTTTGITVVNMSGLPIFPKKEECSLLYRGKKYTPDAFILGTPYFLRQSEESSLWNAMLNAEKTDPDFDFYHETGKLFYLLETDFLENNDFNNRYAIEKSLSSYEDFYEILRKRRAYYETTKKYNFEFVIHGKLLLDVFGQVSKLEFDREIKYPDEVMLKDDFMCYTLAANSSRTFLVLPHPGELCSICNKPFTMDEILQGNVVMKKLTQDSWDKCYHEDCFYEDVKDKNEIYLKGCITKVFNESDCKFQMIPNEYGCNCKLCQNRPWYIVTTPYGKIKIGSRKRVDSISFYKESKFENINFEELFKDEDVTKESTRIDFTIHAWKETDVVRYLKVVKDACDN